MKLILLAILILTLQSCTNNKQNSQLMAYLKNKKNHFIQKVVVNNSVITIKYLPKEVETMLDKKNVYDIVDKNYDEFIHFKININKKGFKPEDKNTINYQNFYVQNDFKLVNMSDTITPAICEKINNGIKDDNEYIVVFTRPVTLSDKFSLVYDDKIYGVGKHEFLYDTNELKNTKF